MTTVSYLGKQYVGVFEFHDETGYDPAVAEKVVAGITGTTAEQVVRQTTELVQRGLATQARCPGVSTTVSVNGKEYVIRVKKSTGVHEQTK